MDRVLYATRYRSVLLLIKFSEIVHRLPAGDAHNIGGHLQYGIYDILLLGIIIMYLPLLVLLLF